MISAETLLAECGPSRILPAEAYEVPVKPVRPEDLSPQTVERLHAMLRKLIFPKSDLLSFVCAVAEKEAHLLWVGEQDGIVVLTGVEPGVAADVNVILWTENPKALLRAFGSAGSVRKKGVECLMESLNLPKLRARIAKENKAGLRLAERAGFKTEGILEKEFQSPTGELVDVILMAHFGGKNA